MFDDKSDSEIIALKQTQAKSDMFLDLQEVFGFDSTTDTDLESLLDDHTARLREALSYKQLYWYFFENDSGEGTINRERMNRYAKMYADAKKGFKALKQDSGVINSYIVNMDR